MDFLTLAMDGLLATLLVAALAYGFKLERKLKALRDSQAGFAEAVRTLDAAAARAEAGLETLRQTTDTAHDELHDRILKARELKQELDRLIGRAERIQEAAPAAPVSDEERALPAAARVREHLAIPRRAEPALRPGAQAPAKRPAARGLDEDLFETTSAPRARTASGVDR